MSRRKAEAVGRVGLVIALLAIVILISVGVNVYLESSLVGHGPPLPSTTVITKTETSTVNALTTTSVTYANDSLSNVLVANISLGCYPFYGALDPTTNVIYAYCASTIAPEPSVRNYSLVAIDANTNKITHRIENVTGGENPVLLLDPVTNMLYIGSEAINGTTDQVTRHLNSNMSFVAVDTKNDILYAVDISNPSGYTLDQINGTNYATITTQFFNGIGFGGFTLDASSNTLFALDSENCPPYGCSGYSTTKGVMAIDAKSLKTESSLWLNSSVLNYASIAFNPKSNVIYVMGLPNLLCVINATSDALLAKIPITGYQNILWDVAVDPSANQIMLTGAPVCVGLSECVSPNLFVLSSVNYGELAVFIDYGSTDVTSFLQFDQTNGVTYMAFQGGYILALNVTTYQ